MLKEMAIEKKKRSFTLPSILIVTGVSMLLAYSTVGGLPAPFCCVLAAVLPPVYTPVIMAGSLMIYLLSGNMSSYAISICALLLTCAGRWFVRDEDSPVLNSGITAVCTGFSAVIFGLLTGSPVTNIMLNILLALAAGSAVYFLHNTVDLILGEKPIKIGKKDELSIAVVYMLMVTVLCSISISFIDPGRIVGTAAILCAAKRFRHQGGVIFGVLTTAGIFLNSPESGIPSVFLGLAGFAAGFMANHSKLGLCTLFLAVNFCGQFLTAMNDASFFLQADVMIGSAIFMFIPENLLMRGQMIHESEEDGSGQLVKIRMDFVAGTLVDVRKSMEDIIKRLETNIAPFNTVNEVSERVCSKCRNKIRCWENCFEKTNSCFLKLEKQSGAITPETFPGGLDNCIRKAEIAESYMRCRKEESINKMLSARLNESRSILFSQMETTEGILSSLSEKMNFNYSKTLTRSLCCLLEKSAIEYSTAIAYFNLNDRLIAEIYVNNMPEESIDSIAQLLSAEFHTPMDAAEPVSCGNEIRLRFSRRTRYTVEFSADQKSAVDGQPSGDSCGFFEDGLGCAYLFISDGMGTGKQAALDSAIVSRLFKRFIKSGIDCDSAVKMLNSIMLTKSGEESFATLDIAKIDLETCELTIFKSGASSTLIKYEDAVMMFNSPSNPIGIIPDSHIFSRTCSFAEGDVLVMLSDGVDESLYLHIKKQLFSNHDLKEVTENVCRCADQKSKSALRDDITVAALRLKERV